MKGLKRFWHHYRPRKKWPPKFLYGWWDTRGTFPVWARWFWPELHFCLELDGALVIDSPDFCECWDYD